MQALPASAILNPSHAEVAYGCVAELVYAYVSETYGAILEGSSPSAPTNKHSNILKNVGMIDEGCLMLKGWCYTKEMKLRRGFAFVPFLVLAGGVLAFAGGFYILSHLFPDVPASRIVRSIEDGGGQTSGGAELVLTDDTLWLGSRLDLFAGYVPEDDTQVRRIAVGPTKSATLDFSVKSKKGVKAVLTNPKGATITTPTKVTTNSDGSVISLYSVPNTSGTSGVWTLTLNNTGGTSAPYQLTIPQTVPVSVSDLTGSYFGATQNIMISIVVQESTQTFAVKAVTGATVVATVTSPSGVVSTVTLTEDTSLNNGTYTGVLNGATEPGTYTVVYTITGRNGEGVQFEQTTTSQFVLSPTGVITGVSSWVKKFDINRGNDLQLIGY